MALKIKTDWCQYDDCSKLQIREITGEYHAVTNTTGWEDASTELLINVDTAKLEIITPENDVARDSNSNLVSPQVIDLKLTEVAISELPNKIFGIKELKSQDFGYADDVKLPDGKYVIDYRVVMNDETEYKYHTTIYLYCQSICCYNELLAKVAGTKCDCDKQLVKDANRAALIVALIKRGSLLNDFKEVALQMKFLKAFCDAAQCKTC